MAASDLQLFLAGLPVEITKKRNSKRFVRLTIGYEVKRLGVHCSLDAAIKIDPSKNKYNCKNNCSYTDVFHNSPQKSLNINLVRERLRS